MSRASCLCLICVSSATVLNRCDMQFSTFSPLSTGISPAQIFRTSEHVHRVLHGWCFSTKSTEKAFEVPTSVHLQPC